MLLLRQEPATMSCHNFREGEHCAKIIVYARMLMTALKQFRAMRNFFNAGLLGNSRMSRMAPRRSLRLWLT